MKYISIFIISSLLVSSQKINSQQLSATISTTLDEKQRATINNQESVIIGKKLPLAANQLLISWNIIRPDQGYFSIHTQIYNKQMHAWSPWYKIAVWGAHTQRSFEHKNASPLPSFYNVRLHMPSNYQASHCRVKIQTHEGARLENVHRINICAIDTKAFKPEFGRGKKFSFNSVHIKNLPKISQFALEHPDKTRICSPVSLSMVVSYLNGDKESPYLFPDGVFDNGLQAYGSWPFNTAHAFDRCNGKYYFTVARLNSFAELHGYLRKNLPIIVSVRGPMRGMPAGRTYEDGHLLVVVGWDNKTKRVLCHDPAFDDDESVAHSYEINDFLAAFERAGKNGARLAYVVEPRSSKDTF